MSTIRVKLRMSTVAGKAGSIYYQVIHRRQQVQLTSSVKLYPHEWDAPSARICANGEKASFLLAAQRTINADLAVLHGIISRKEAAGVPYATADIAFAFRALAPAEEDFFLYMEKRIFKLEEEKAHGTELNYQRAYRSFAAFLNRQYLPFPACTEILIGEYEQWLRQRKIKRNSSSFYMRILRAVYNSAVSDGLAPAGNPFRKVYTGIDTTRKRAVDKHVIKQLKKLDLTEKPALAYARDLFLFSLYLRGMAFVDMAYLQKCDIQHGGVTYIRRKTGIRLSIKMEPCLQEIIDRYEEKAKDPYVLPIITSADEKQAYREYQNALNYYNKQLKRLSGMLKDGVSLSSYIPRHTWATTARDSNIPLSVISAGMGHSSENITRIYLSSLDNSVIDKANYKIISVFD
ncbi:site-specific integrase [uncultured Proteiniphilum sp.]|uniref:tyrosine-type recombinase/integrase n=1 Tax=uncultured Proteiniphilum sp. TaxID=497637 RepID=UPI00260EB38B|nr:site-specific integrase [uncultured Proteiniphilum sp.]